MTTKKKVVKASAVLGPKPSDVRKLQPVELWNLELNDSEGDLVDASELSEENIEFLLQELRKELLEAIS